LAEGGEDNWVAVELAICQ